MKGWKEERNIRKEAMEENHVRKDGYNPTQESLHHALPSYAPSLNDPIVMAAHNVLPVGGGAI